MTCPITDLPTDTCGCREHHRPRQTVISIAALERISGRPLPAYRAIVRPPWNVPTPEPTSCDHRQDDLCGPCSKLLRELLADLPHLVEDLGYAMRKDVRFAPHGHRKGDAQHPDESPLPWNPAAAQVLGELNRLQAIHWTASERRILLADLSHIAARAHHIIDRPRERALTMCPTCRAEIVVPDDNPETRMIICPADDCTYAATWQQHLADLLDANGDAMFTAEELRFILTHNGEPITRFRIRYLVERHGLPREQLTIPAWKDKRLVTEARYAFKLRDVRDLQARLAS